ncbi:MAG: hypothetical protein IPP90_05685 [Gemmatimonadaceae bacterium]|nr:hypothetical protein [Gemmatimonadaceae bacterium]
MPITSAKSTNRPSAGDARAARDRRIVSGLIGVFVVGALWLASLSVADSSRKAQAKTQMGQTFAVVHRRQSEFRSLTGRFATWPELRQRGATLGPRQTVNSSNADASHWFISIRDQQAGVICDRTGELMDEDRFERTPVCRDAP